MHKFLVTTSIFLACLASIANADWDPGDYTIMEDPFLPDLSTAGMDMNVSDMTLAEDFYTCETSLVTDIHIWGTWLDDVLPEGDTSNVGFTLGLHENAVVEGPYGPEDKPGVPIWYGNFGQYTGGYQERYFTVREYATGVGSTWLRPSNGETSPNAATTCYQYNCHIVIDPPELEWDEHYWLVIRAYPTTEDAKFGLKTSPEGCCGWSQWTWGGEPLNNPESWVTVYLGGAVPLSFVVTGPLPGDTDGDGDVDLSDLAALLAVYGACDGDPNFDATIDYDESGCIDLPDLATLLSNYGTGT